jgi:hypothetical protein
MLGDSENVNRLTDIRNYVPLSLALNLNLGKLGASGELVAGVQQCAPVRSTSGPRGGESLPHRPMVITKRGIQVYG